MDKEYPKSATNGVTMRSWPISILYHNCNSEYVIRGTIKQGNVTHYNNDALYSAVFVNLLIHKLINGIGLSLAIKESIRSIKSHISSELLEALEGGYKKEYEDLKGGSGWIVDTMNVVMWSILNTKNFKDAIIMAANVRGDTDTNASITGSIAGALYGYSKIPENWLDIMNMENPYNVWSKGLINVDTFKDILGTLSKC